VATTSAGPTIAPTGTHAHMEHQLDTAVLLDLAVLRASDGACGQAYSRHPRDAPGIVRSGSSANSRTGETGSERRSITSRN
jgi:hypothetical protein